MLLVTYYAIIMMVATWLGHDMEASWSKLAAAVEEMEKQQSRFETNATRLREIALVFDLSLCIQSACNQPYSRIYKETQTKCVTLTFATIILVMHVKYMHVARLTISVKLGYRIAGNFREAEIFCDFREQAPARENLFMRKFFPPKIFC